MTTETENGKRTELNKLKAEIEKIQAETEAIKKNNSKGAITLKYVVAGFLFVSYLFFIADPILDKYKLDNEIIKRENLIVKMRNDSTKKAQDKNITVLNLSFLELRKLVESFVEERDRLLNTRDEMRVKISDLKIEIAKCNNPEGSKKLTDELLQIEEKSQSTSEGVVHEQMQSDSIVDNIQIVLEKREGNVNKPTKRVEGWMYAGHFKNNIWGGTNTLIIGDSLPEKPEEFLTDRDVMLRINHPKGPFYRLPDIKTVIKKGTKVKILDVEDDIGFNKVWVEVETVMSK